MVPSNQRPLYLRDREVYAVITEVINSLDEDVQAFSPYLQLELKSL